MSNFAGDSGFKAKKWRFLRNGIDGGKAFYDSNPISVTQMAKERRFLRNEKYSVFKEPCRMRIRLWTRSLRFLFEDSGKPRTGTVVGDLQSGSIVLWELPLGKNSSILRSGDQFVVDFAAIGIRHASQIIANDAFQRFLIEPFAITRRNVFGTFEEELK
jgi:hypothetical protein